MTKVIGNTTATPNPRPDWNQTDPTKADYIKNKPNLQVGLKYYGVAGVTPSPIEWFNHTIDNENNTVTITGMSSNWMELEDESKNEIVIPYEIDGNGVVGIGDNAFQWNEFTSIKLPIGLINIGEMAFYGCNNLTSIDLPDSITNIGHNAFGECTNLAFVNMSESVTIIADGMFYGCNKLASIKLPAGLLEIGISAFYSCTSFTSIDLPDSITTIKDFAFYSCMNLININMPHSVTSIGESALDLSVTIICSKGSYAETYAKENGYNYEYDTVTPSDYISDLAIEDNIITVIKGDGSASELDLPIGGTHGSVIVDDVLSDTSENPVQNKVVTNWITTLNNYIALVDAEKAPVEHTHKIVDLEDYVVDEVLDITSENPVQNKHIASHITDLMEADAALSSKVDQEIENIDKKLAELEEKVDESIDGGDIVIDAELSDTSENPVQNKIITQLLNKHLYTYTTADTADVVIPLETNSITYVYGEYAENNNIGFAFSSSQERTNDIPEEIVLILDLSSFTENPSVMFPSIIKWFGGEPPEVESGKVYMFSFIYVKGISSPYYLGIGGEFI